MTPVDPAAYLPRRRDWVYLAVYQQLSAETGRPTCEAIGNELKVTKQAVSQMEHRPGFVAWRGAELEKRVPGAKGGVLTRFAALAGRGSVPHADWLAKVCGWYAPAVNASRAGVQQTANTINSFTVVMGVPDGGPPDPARPGGLPLPGQKETTP